jgi:hypothetical protein
MALRAAADILRRFGLTWCGGAVWASGADAADAVGAAGSRNPTVIDKIRDAKDFKTVLDTLCLDLSDASDHYKLFRNLIAAKLRWPVQRRPAEWRCDR